MRSTITFALTILDCGYLLLHHSLRAVSRGRHFNYCHLTHSYTGSSGRPLRSVRR